MEENMARFICENCRYTFRRNKSWAGVLCPYCGKPNCCKRDDEINDMINSII